MSEKEPKKEPRNLAPFVIFGGMLLIGTSTVGAVFIGRCTTEQNLMDPHLIKREWRKQPRPLSPPASPSPSAPVAVPAPDASVPGGGTGD